MQKTKDAYRAKQSRTTTKHGQDPRLVKGGSLFGKIYGKAPSTATKEPNKT